MQTLAVAFLGWLRDSFRIDGSRLVWRFAHPLGFDSRTGRYSGPRFDPFFPGHRIFDLLPLQAARMAGKRGNASRNFQLTLLDIRGFFAGDDQSGISSCLETLCDTPSAADQRMRLFALVTAFWLVALGGTILLNRIPLF